MKKIDRPEGAFWSCVTDQQLPAGFYQYKYFVSFTDHAVEWRKVSDPYTRYGGTDNQNAAIVVGGSRPEDNTIVPLAERKIARSGRL
jgi:1,4-alpha-glucan branching enzyme